MLTERLHFASVGRRAKNWLRDKRAV